MIHRTVGPPLPLAGGGWGNGAARTLQGPLTPIPSREERGTSDRSGAPCHAMVA
jgi:hypothetical protein